MNLLYFECPLLSLSNYFVSGKLELLLMHHLCYKPSRNEKKKSYMLCFLKNLLFYCYFGMFYVQGSLFNSKHLLARVLPSL